MSDSKISNKKYTVNTYEWTGEEIYFLGKYLEAQADILKKAAGRWAGRYGVEEKIEIPNLSVLTNSLESVGKVAWDMRCSIQLEISGEEDTQEKEDAIKQKRKWERLIAEETDEENREILQLGLAKATKRLKEVMSKKRDRQDTSFRFDDPPHLLHETDELSKLWSDETLTQTERQMIRPVVEHMIQANDIRYVHDALNKPWHEIANGQSRHKADVLRWAFARFGFRWRTNDDKTRFDMPVERYKFAKSRERIKDLRAAGNRWDKPFELKLLKEDGRGKAEKSSAQTLRDLLDDILKDSGEAHKSASKLVIPRIWLNKVAALFGYFPSMLPQGIWAAVDSPDDMKVHDKDIITYNPDLSKVLRELAERKVKPGHRIKIVCSSLQRSYYLRGVGQRIATICSLHGFINLISVIVFRWTADVELQIAEEVFEDSVTGETSVQRLHFHSENPVVASLDTFDFEDDNGEHCYVAAITFAEMKERSSHRRLPFFKYLPDDLWEELRRKQDYRHNDSL